MICPLMSRPHPVNAEYEDQHDLFKVSCLKHECGWWDSINGGCAVLSLIQVLDDIE